jgi:hypothetical protein
LELAESPEFPRGSVGRGFLIRLPLDETGDIDEHALAREPHKAAVRRFWSSEPDEVGRLVNYDNRLALRCHGKSDRILCIRSSIRIGENVEIICDDGNRNVFRVADVRPIAAFARP